MEQARLARADRGQAGGAAQDHERPVAPAEGHDISAACGVVQHRQPDGVAVERRHPVEIAHVERDGGHRDAR